MNKLTAKVLEVIERSKHISETFHLRCGNYVSSYVYVLGDLTLDRYNGILKVMYGASEIGFIRNADYEIVCAALHDKQKLIKNNALNQFLDRG
jgi:hypothetical protein